MWSRADKLRFRRRFRMRRRQVVTIGEETEQQLDQHFFQRLDKLVPVRRFVAGWTILVVIGISAVATQTVLLSTYYQTLQPAPGGVYAEGIIGDFTNANPLYASSLADKTVSKLLFSGLLKYNDSNELVGDLASKWSVDQRGEVYTVELRKNLRWHDGQILTADDVVFTYQMIQNADAQSPLQPSWQGVKVAAKDSRTVTFTLANPLASFPYGLTNGIIPKHILNGVDPADMRSVSFNTSEPIGSGPFQWQGLEVRGADPLLREVRIALTAYKSYHLGEPKLEGFSVRVFRDYDRMLQSYEKRELHALAGLVTVPENSDRGYEVLSFPQTAAVMTFFKTTDGVLKEKAVRQALVRATDNRAVRKQLGYVTPLVVSPLLRNQIGYDPKIVQLGYDINAAEKLLEDSGWKREAGKEIRQKNEKPLEFTLYAEKNEESEVVTKELQKQWRRIGVDVKIALQDTTEFQLTLSGHTYDALLRGISIGKDPDVFVYWHSSQSDIGLGKYLNFAEYESKTADESLESARTRIDEDLRAEKYQPFLRAWRSDAPAVGLYQPRSLYITRNVVYNLEEHEVNEASDRLADVHEWMIRRVKTTVD